MKCPKCKTPLRKGSKFCPKCGAKVKHIARNILMIMLAVALLLGGAGVASWKLGLFQTTGGVADENFTLLSGTFTDRLIVDQESALAAIGDVADILGIEDVNAEFSDCKVDTVSGNTYYRFYQEYEGVPVYGRSIVVVADEDGKGLSLSGNYVPVLELSTDTTASQEAINSVIQEYFCERLSVSKIDNLFVEEISTNAMCIYNMGDHSSLAYQLYAEVPQIGCYEMLVNAQEPKVLYANALIQYNYEYEENGKMENISANGQEIVQSIDVYRNPERYIMADTSRNIEVYKMQGQFWWGYSKNTNEIDEISWVSEEELQEYTNEVDALANVQLAYDYFEENLAHHSTDGNGDATIFIFTDWGFAESATLKDKPIYLDNAFSDSNTDENWTVICIGLTKNKADNTQSANLDVVAHEYTHAVIKFACNLGGQDETSAINEGISDVFGELVEEWKNGSCDWVHGNRTIYKPSVNGYAETASDSNNGTEDYTHGHSTVISHAAYLMYTGIDGSSTVESLSTNDLAHLFYRTLYTLPSDCTFSQFRTLVENTADIMCQQGALTEKQRLCVSNAFSQVGISPSQAVCYTVSGELSLLIYDVNREQYNDYDVTVSRMTGVQGPGITSPLKKVSETYAANEIIHLDEGKAYQITIIDKNGNQDSVIYYVNVQSSGKNELEIYTSFGEAANDAFPAYLEAAKLTTSSGSWTEDLTMTANMTLTSGNSTTKATATVGATTDIDGYMENDPSSLRMSGSANMAVAGQYYAWNMTYANGVAHYDYTEPTITSADVKIDPSYFDFSSITPDMVSASSFLGNTIKFTVREDALTEVGISAVGLMDGIENLSYGDVDVVATVNTDTGKIDTLSMSFHASMTYQGYDAEVDYTIEYRFLDRKAVSSAQILSDDIVDVVLKNESVWVSPFTDYFDESWSAYFMDLDFDGIPEFFVESDMMGSGMYTYRSIYQVEDGRLLELNDPEITESDWDSLTLCKDQQSGEFFFLGEDYIREGVEWYSQSWAKVGVRLGQLTHTMLYSKSQTGDEFNYYGSNREITEDEFYNLQSEFEKNTLNLGSPRGTVIDLWDTQISFEQKRAILLDAYSSVPTGEWVNGFSNTNISDSLS